ncbi:MAG: ferrochelatase, partial [Rhizomicrobium sp.]
MLFNLGGPENLAGVEPFLRNLFSDPAIITLPAPFRLWLARFIAKRRSPTASAIYRAIGGGSPILRETEAQAVALQQVLGGNTRVFIAMRYTPPFAVDTVRALQHFAPDHIILLPLYPQYSKTTTGSSLAEWHQVAARAGVTAPTHSVCCYATLPGFIAALTDLTAAAAKKCQPGLSYRLLLSAHGLPERVINSGDPYAEHVEATAKALAAALGRTDYQVCYQSKVGPLKWIGPATL